MKSSNFLPFALPDIGEEEIAEVVETLRQGWITSGPKTKRFEKEFAGFLGHGVEAVAVNSATAGLHLAVEAIGLGPGDQAIVPTHTFTATAEVLRYVGADPVFVDIEPETYCLSPERAAAAMTDRVRAVVPVHFAGHSCRMDKIVEFARERSIAVIEDAAHALPTHSGGKLIGTLETTATVFSFYATKTIATGEGGMLVTRDKDVVTRARVMRLHGIDRDAFERYRSDRPAWYYEVVAPGYKYNMTDVAAAIGIHQLRRAPQFHARRLQLAARYDQELADLPMKLPPRPPDREWHAWHLYVVALADDCSRSRDEVIQKMFERGIGCSVHFIPLHRQPYWRNRYGLQPQSFPVSERLFSRGISLPIYTRMTDDDQSRVIEALKSVLRSR